MGITRGKTDKVDSARIAQFGIEKCRTLEIAKSLNESILQLKEWLDFRKILIRENAGYKKQIAERKHIYEFKKKDLICKILAQKIKTNLVQIAELEKAISDIIEGNIDFQKNFLLLTSVRGIKRLDDPSLYRKL
jgi:transposase